MIYESNTYVVRNGFPVLGKVSKTIKNIFQVYHPNYEKEMF